jgi:hypothetical protein
MKPSALHHNSKEITMPYDYAVLDNGQGSGGKKPRSAKVKYVRAYLKSKGMAPTKDAASRSSRERKLRAKARAEFAAMGKKKSGGSSRSTVTNPSTAKNSDTKKVVTATRRRETAEDREAYRESKIKRTNPLSPAERRSGGLGNSKRERSRGMSAAEARWLDYGPKKRAIVVASNRKSPNRNYKPGKNR